MTVLCVGSVAVDTLELPHGRYPRVLGGSATYAALASSLLAKTRLVGIVGDDFEEAHVALLRRRGIDLDGLQRVVGRTFHWEGRYTPDLTARETLRTELGVFEAFEPRLPAAYKKSEVVALGNIQPALQGHVLDQIERPRAVIADTMNLWITTERDALAATLGRVDVLLVNDEEARQLAGEWNLVRAARTIAALGPRIVLVKRGDAGATMFDFRNAKNGQPVVFTVPCYPTADVKDPTGAGDAFLGAFAGSLARDGGGSPLDPTALRRAALWGSALGSFSVETVGADGLGAIALPDADARVHDLEGMLRV